MSRALFVCLSMILVLLDVSFSLRLRLAVALDETDAPCPTYAAEARNYASQQVLALLQNQVPVPECGPGYWVQVANLNLTDPQQNCPSPWVMETTPGRSCAAASPPCASVYFNRFGVMYQKVCGMALGYAINSPDAFVHLFGDGGIDGAYLDGVSITHGQPRQHIWSLAAGHGGNRRCPCDNTDRNRAPLPPSFVGNNYFCDGDYNGALWDGEGCTTACCTFNSPPWFTATLPAPTTDSIEARICLDQGADDERLFLNTLSLFVQ